ncbi:MAG: type II toxin-antitoxin system Phd/YefM family antitoxin [Solimonas sp.]
MERKISAAAFKAKCLALIDEVADSGQPITVTKRGKAKVQIVAVREKPSVREKPRTLLGATKGTFRILGDIVGPIVDEWDEDREWRNLTGQFDGSPARYSRDPVTGRARGKARKGGKRKVRRQDARS